MYNLVLLFPLLNTLLLSLSFDIGIYDTNYLNVTLINNPKEQIQIQHISKQISRSIKIRNLK